MRSFLAWFIVCTVLSIALSGALSNHIAAEPFGGAGLTFGKANHQTIVDQVHGFHCRPVLGWDPVAGVYSKHSHEGICSNYQRCLRAQKRCIFLLGGGRKPWSYELFGFDTDRFTACMIRTGCY